jgi:hypothetical protein
MFFDERHGCSAGRRNVHMFYNHEGGMKQMGGTMKYSLPVSGVRAVHRPATRAQAQGYEEQRYFETSRQTEKVIAAMVGEVIGRQGVLHALLEPADFPVRFVAKNEGRCRWSRRCEAGPGPLQVSFSSHRMYYECQYVTIVSEGSLRSADGKQTGVVMEVSLERIGIPLTRRTRQWTKGNNPLIVNFTTGPVIFTEAAFSFDIEREGTHRNHRLLGCGYMAVMNGQDADV